jgi:hypothetical protein
MLHGLKQRAELTDLSKMDKIICKCELETTIENLILKMGGLICQDCRVIVFWPESKEYSEEFKRRSPPDFQNKENSKSDQ